MSTDKTRQKEAKKKLNTQQKQNRGKKRHKAKLKTESIKHNT